MQKPKMPGVSQLPEVHQWLKDAAQEDVSYAHWRLALAHIEGNFESPSLEAAAHHLREAIRLELGLAPMALIDLIISGAVPLLPHESILDLLETGAKLGHVITMREYAKRLVLSSKQDPNLLLKARHYLKFAEWNGCIQSRLEGLYIDALGVGYLPNKGESLGRVRLSGRAGNGAATYCYAMMIYHGYIGEPSEERGLSLLQEAIRMGCDDASVDIMIHAREHPAFELPEDATRAFERLLLKEDPRAMHCHAETLLAGSEILSSQTAHRYLDLCMKRNYAPAFLTAENAARDSHSVDACVKSIQMLEQAASIGLISSTLHSLGARSRDLMDLNQTFDEHLFQHILRAAPYDYSLSNMAGLYYSGHQGSPIDRTHMYFWLAASVLDGSDNSARSIGIELKTSGTDGKPNDALGMAFFRYAAQLGNAYSCALLADDFLIGTDHTMKNEREAAHWFYQGATLGYRYCQSKLAWCYANGIGVTEDVEKAEYWDDIANRADEYDSSLNRPPLHSGERVNEDSNDKGNSVLLPFKKSS